MVNRKSLFLVTLAALLAGTLIGSQLMRPPTVPAPTPADISAEAGFARDMGDHHQQAVDMAFIIRDNSQDTAVRELAFDIINTQSTQRGMMMGWLEQWGLQQTTVRPAMAWMDKKQGASASGGHDSMPLSESGDARMPGMASPDEIDRLRGITGQDAEVLFMQLMVRHHTGGITMAKGVLDRTDRDEVRRLARAIVNGQQAEIDLLREMLKERGAKT